MKNGADRSEAALERDAGTEREPRVGRGVRLEGVRLVGRDLIEADLRDSAWIDCEVVECDLTLARMDRATVRGTTFTSCRLLGVDVGAWAEDLLGTDAAFIGCDLERLQVHGVDLRGCRFEGGQARESRWTRVDLREVAFVGVDLTGARFEACDLRGADLSTATGVHLDPRANRVEGLKVDLAGAAAMAVAMGVEVDL